MSACCVSGCKNRHSSGSKLKFYRIPSKCRPFQANRRRLWLQAIHRANGSPAELNGNARVCGAHFISGEASMDHDSPDFVPSVFACTQSQNPKKKAKWIYGRRKRRRRKANVKEEEKTRVASPVDVQSSVLTEETQALSSLSVPKEGETLTNEAETETKTIESSSPNTQVPADFPKLGKKIPTLSLKSVFLPAQGYRCELCSQVFTDATQLIKHKQLHEDTNQPICEDGGKIFTAQAAFTEQQHVQQPSFPCNMCDRSFTTSHNLKRHKLLHVKDGRKCRKCGVIFCRLHNHVVFLPQSGTEAKQESSAVESLLEKPNQSSDLEDDAQGTSTVTEMQPTSPAPPKPLPRIHNPLPPASHTRIIRKIPVPVLKRVSLQLPPPRSSRDGCPADVAQPRPRQYPELPPSLRLFSPQCLTSALLEVERNYEYILSKARDGKNKVDIVKKEPCELPVIQPAEQNAEADETKGRIAYDLEIVL